MAADINTQLQNITTDVTAISNLVNRLVTIFSAGGVQNPDLATLKGELQGWTTTQLGNYAKVNALNTFSAQQNFTDRVNLIAQTCYLTSRSSVDAQYGTGQIIFRHLDDENKIFFRVLSLNDTLTYDATFVCYSDGECYFTVPALSLNDTTHTGTKNISVINLSYLDNLGNSVVHKDGYEIIGGSKHIKDGLHFEGTEENPYFWLRCVEGVYNEIGDRNLFYQTFYQKLQDGNNNGVLHTYLRHYQGSFSYGIHFASNDKGLTLSCNDTTDAVSCFVNGEIITSGDVYPVGNNTASLGKDGNRWKEVFAITGTINTSDERMKEEISDIPEAVMRAWGKVKFQQFKMKDAVAKKGSTNARIHMGVIAQRIKEAFASEGLDATKYGLFCWDKWKDSYEDVEVVNVPETTKEVKVVDAQAIYNTIFKDDGTEEQVLVSPEKWHMEKEIVPAKTHIEKKLANSAGEMYSVRYEECLALECAYQRWVLKKIADKVGAVL